MLRGHVILRLGGHVCEGTRAHSLHLLDAGLGGGQAVALSVAERLVQMGTQAERSCRCRDERQTDSVRLGTVHTADLHSLRRGWSVGRAARSLRAYDVLYSHTSIPGEVLEDLAAWIAGERHVFHLTHRHASAPTG